MKLTVSENRRFLVRRDGRPFFRLGDTAWQLVHKLTRDQICFYLDNRRAKGFTIVQTVCLAEAGGVDVPNMEGELALIDGDITKPNDRYFDLVEFVIDEARAREMYIALLPTWGSYGATIEWETHWFPRHELFPPSTGAHARDYGRYVGARFADKDNVIWVNGGDQIPELAGIRTWMELAAGIAEGATGGENYDELVMTYHPRGGRSSSAFFHHEPWLTFNMMQTGHDPRVDIPEMVAHDYWLPATKPTINGEPMYERLPMWCRPANRKQTTAEVRRAAYQSVFAGAFGHTYGANEVWMMWEPDRDYGNDPDGTFLAADTPWQDALDYPGARQMGYLRALVESRPMLTRVPDQSMVTSGAPGTVATRDTDGTYAMVYMPCDGRYELDLAALGGKATVGTWMDPRNGVTQPAAQHKSFWKTPGDGDWVLVVDAEDAGYPRMIESGW